MAFILLDSNNIVKMKSCEVIIGGLEVDDSVVCGQIMQSDGSFINPPIVIVAPQSITALQGLLAIDAAGLSTAYEAWANSADRTFAEKAFINRAQIWKRDDAIVLSAAALFGLTETQLDEFFISASKQ